MVLESMVGSTLLHFAYALRTATSLVITCRHVRFDPPGRPLILIVAGVSKTICKVTCRRVMPNPHFVDPVPASTPAASPAFPSSGSDAASASPGPRSSSSSNGSSSREPPHSTVPRPIGGGVGCRLVGRTPCCMGWRPRLCWSAPRPPPVGLSPFRSADHPPTTSRWGGQRCSRATTGGGGRGLSCVEGAGGGAGLRRQEEGGRRRSRDRKEKDR